MTNTQKKFKLLLGSKEDPSPKTIFTLLGILVDKHDRILFSINPEGKTYLPGGSSRKKYDSQRLKNSLQKFIYKKTGIWAEVKDTIGIRKIGKNERKKAYIYQLSFTSNSPFPKPWKISPDYQITWLSLKEINEHPDISPFIKSIITNYASSEIPRIN